MSSWWVLSLEETIALIGIPVLGGALGRSVAWLLVCVAMGKMAGGWTVQPPSAAQAKVYAGDPGISARLEQVDEDVRTGKRTPESLALLSRETVRGVRIIRRADADDGTERW